MSLGLFVITIHLFTFVFFCQLSARFSSLFLPHGNRLSHPSMDRHLDNYQAVVGDALRLLESSQLSDARLSSWQTVLCGLLRSAANSTAGRHTTTNPTGTLQFPTDLPSLNARLSEPFVHTVCATALSDAILQFFQQFIASANTDDLSVAAQSNSLPVGHGRLREMFDPLLSFVAFVTIVCDYRGDISRAWSAYSACLRGTTTRDRTPAPQPSPPNVVVLNPINQISNNPLGWRVLLALFFGVQSTDRPVSLRNSSIKTPHYDVRHAIVSRWIQATAANGYQKVTNCAEFYKDAMRKYDGDAPPSLLAKAFAHGGFESLDEFLGEGNNIDVIMGITDLLIPDDMADMARAHLQSPRVRLDPLKAAVPQYEELVKLFDGRSKLKRYKVAHPTDPDGAFYVMVLANLLSGRSYAWCYFLLNQRTAYIVPDGMSRGNHMLSVSTMRPDWHPDAVFAIGSGNGSSVVKFYPCKRSNTKLEVAIYRILNLVLAAVSEGIVEYLAEHGGAEDCGFQHHGINTILSNLFDTVKVGFGPHSDSDPTNSREPGESYEDTFLPLASELATFTLCFPSPELFTNPDCKDAHVAVYKYSASSSGAPLLPIVAEHGFESTKVLEVPGNGCSYQSQLSQLDCFHSVSMKHNYRCHKDCVRFIASARKQPLRDASSSLRPRIALWEKRSQQSFAKAKKMTAR